MRDDESRFCAELARSVGRLDWWNIKAEHTPYQWACQIAMYRVAPWGERRADRRAAFNTASMRAAMAVGEVTAEDMREVVLSLMNYMPCDAIDPDDVEHNEAALAAITGKEA